MQDTIAFKTLVALGVFFTYNAVIAAADVFDPTTPTWIKEIPAAAALIWYMWYTQCRTMPRLEANHSANLSQQRADHKEIITTLTDSHHASVTEMTESIKTLTESFSAELERFRECLKDK